MTYQPTSWDHLYPHTSVLNPLPSHLSQPEPVMPNLEFLAVTGAWDSGRRTLSRLLAQSQDLLIRINHRNQYFLSIISKLRKRQPLSRPLFDGVVRLNNKHTGKYIPREPPNHYTPSALAISLSTSSHSPGCTIRTSHTSSSFPIFCWTSILASTS